MKKIFFGKASKGKLVLDDNKGFMELVCLLEGKEIEVTIAKKKKKRSNNQNAYFHAVIVPLISKAIWYEKSEVKEMLRNLFLSYELKVGDSIIKVGRSTASLTTVEFEEFNSECRRFASIEIGIYIPTPNEIEY